MAAVTTEGLRRDSPGPTKMAAMSVGGGAMSLGGGGMSLGGGSMSLVGGTMDSRTPGGGDKTFSNHHGLNMAEDRRTKEKEMNNIQNLMEYREAPASPSASSVTTTLSLENCGSPDTPNSPPPPPETQEMDDERLPNELLEELCEDIGMKEGMELDFVEFLMEQDMGDPQQYMTAEALRSSGFPTPTNGSKASSTLNTPTNKSSGNDQLWGNRNCGSPSYSIASSTNVTVATSSGSSSPVSKRFHMSNSGPPSPPPLSHMGNHVFKAPQTPPTPRRPIPTSQGAMSPRSNLSGSSNQSNNSEHSSHSNHSSVHSNHMNQNLNNVSMRCNSPRTVGGAPSPQLPHSTTGQSAFNKPPPQYGQYPNQSQNNAQKSLPSNQPLQRLGRPVPPNVNVQNFQQQHQNQKYMSPVPHTQGNQSCAMNNSGNLGNMSMSMPNQCQTASTQFNRPVDSPLDQGYFTSSDSMSTRSYDSVSTSTVPSSVSNSMHPMASNQHKMPGGVGTPQKSVHFTGNMGQGYTPRQNEGLPYEPCYRNNVPDCELEEYRNSIQKMHSKMMPRLNHHGKPETAPYTVPSNNGQGSMNPYEYSNGQAGMGNMQQQQQQQQYYQQKPANNGFGMDNNQNLVMPNYNEGLSNQGMPNMMGSSCSGAPGMGGGMPQPQMDGYRGQSQCQLQDPVKGQMYDPMNMQNSMIKGHINDANCQYSGQTQGNMNENCGMMGMNQGMMGNRNTGAMNPGTQNGMNQNFNNYNGMNQSQQQQSGYHGQQRAMNMNMPSASTSGSGMIGGYDPAYVEHTTRALAGQITMNNMDSSMFPQPNPNGMNDWGGGMPGQLQSHQMGVAPQSNPMGISGQDMAMSQGQCGQMTGVPCAIPNCANCKHSSPNRPPMMASQQRFIQHLITDRSNAFRSHPLFPLLRDLIIADMNFSTPNFPYQLISNLPADFDKLLQNFLHRNPPAGNYQSNVAVESVVMDALKYAHHCLIEKIRQKQDQDVDKHSKSTSKSLSAVEEFCEKFDQSVRKSYIKPATLHLGGVGPGNHGNMGTGVQMQGNMGPPEMNTPTKDLKYQMGMGGMMMPGGMFMSPQAKKGLEFGGMMSPNFKSLSDFDNASDCGSVVSSSSHNTKESKKHPSLPKEAVAIMLDWLRQHKDNPYPNDDEKAMLIKQTGLTINQINYWFTNARRRILPKWAQQQCKT